MTKRDAGGARISRESGDPCFGSLRNESTINRFTTKDTKSAKVRKITEFHLRRIRRIRRIRVIRG
jgi:hypothetical protein